MIRPVTAAVSVILLAGAAVPSGSASAWVSPTGSEHDFGTSLQVTGGDMGTAYDRQFARYGGIEMVRIFYRGMPPAWSVITGHVHDAKVIVSFVIDPQLILSGSLDEEFSTWFASAPSDRITRWVYWHEPENDIERDQLEPAKYRAAWRHLIAFEDQSVREPQLDATMILMCWTFQPRARRDVATYWPGVRPNGQAWLDSVAFDCYNAGHRTGRYRPVTNLLGPPVDWAESLGPLGVTWGIAEFGSVIVNGTTGSDRAAWIDAMVTYIQAHGGQFTSYFDHRKKATSDYRLLDTPSQTMYASIIQNR